ncbi:helix-turn-helix domain-containing protein, partial [Desulfovibrio sp.]|uniref:TetR/AcrR family transcriptional regulator n=1 Tax=Desulfovibrio sp. TaxID=885 RepID=UPI0023CB22DF
PKRRQRVDRKQRDLRVTKTLARIREAFLKLVSETSYDELTVSALCAQAQIGRKTFYVYYSSLDSLFEEILEEITRDYLHSIKDYSAPENIREITRIFYEFSTRQGKYYDNLVCSDSYQRLGARLIMRLVRGTWFASSWFTSLSRERQDILLCFIYNSGAGLYRQWILSGKSIPLETMIEYADCLIAKGIEGFRNLE